VPGARPQRPRVLDVRSRVAGVEPEAPYVAPVLSPEEALDVLDAMGREVEVEIARRRRGNA
jgi:hypothetical protein